MSNSCDPVDYSLPGSPVHGIFQVRILEWDAISSSRGSSRPRIKPAPPALTGRLFITEPTWKPIYKHTYIHMGFPHSSVSKESACNAGHLGLIPGLGRSPGEGNGNPLQYSCLENSMDSRAWQATVHGVTRIRHDFATKQQQTQYLLFSPDPQSFLILQNE